MAPAFGLACIPLQAATASPEQITVTGDGTRDARVLAPTSQPLDATQPTSVFGKQYISNTIPPQGDYAQVIALSPSAVAIDQNGPGGAFSNEVSIRGFQDGQYNVTLDGIPFGDSNNYTHHTSVYFMNRDLERIAVDRGPGTASTIGDATFGGTISLDSKAPAQHAALTPMPRAAASTPRSTARNSTPANSPAASRRCSTASIPRAPAR